MQIVSGVLSYAIERAHQAQTLIHLKKNQLEDLFPGKTLKDKTIKVRS